MAASIQVVVLGAGMVGVASALALQARGYQVALMDRAGPGAETSYGNAGIIQAEACEPYALPRDMSALFRIALKSDNSVDWDLLGLGRAGPALISYWLHSAPPRHRLISRNYAPLIRRAASDHAAWISESGAEGLIQRKGYRLVFRDPAAFDSQAAKAEAWRNRYGVSYASEDGAALAIAEPALRRPLAGAIHWRDAWTCRDPGALVEAYAALFVRRGGALLNAELRSLEPSAHGWWVRSSAGSVETESVVVALGPWSPQALAPLGYRIKMIQKRGYHMHFAYPDAQTDGSNLRLTVPVIDADMGAVYAPMRAGLRVATGADLSAREPDGMPRQLRRAAAAAQDLLDIGSAVESSAWRGKRPCMPDMLPLVGAAPRHRGLWFNFGHGHQGFTLGPTTGELLAGLIDGDADPDVLPLAPSRLNPG